MRLCANKQMRPHCEGNLTVYYRYGGRLVLSYVLHIFDCSGSVALVALLNQKAAGWSAARTLLLLDDAYQAAAPLIATSTNRRQRKADVDSADRSISLRVLDVDGDGALDVMVSVRPSRAAPRHATPRRARVPKPSACREHRAVRRTYHWSRLAPVVARRSALPCRTATISCKCARRMKHTTAQCYRYCGLRRVTCGEIMRAYSVIHRPT